MLPISVHILLIPFTIYHCSDDRIALVPQNKGFAFKEKAVCFAYSLTHLDISEYVHVRIGIVDRSCRDSDSLTEISVPRT